MSDSTIGRGGVDTWLSQLGLPATAGGAVGSSGAPSTSAGANQAQAAAAGQVGQAGPLDAVAASASAQGNKFVGGASSSQLPPIAPPPLPTTASTVQETHSFLQESQAAVQGAAQHVSTLPGSSTVVQPFDPNAQTSAQAAGQLVKWGTNQAQAIPALARSTLGQFLLMRVKSDEAGVKALQGLAGLSTSAQGTLIEQEMAQSKVAEAAAKKAAAKAAHLGIFGKIFQAVVAVVSVVLAVCSFGTLSGVAIGLILAASAIAFITTGAVEGKKSGKGFDFLGALDAFSMAISLGTLGTLLKGVSTAAIDTTIKALTKGATKAAEKAGMRTASAAAEKGGEGAAKAGSDDILAAALRTGGADTPGAAGNASQQAVRQGQQTLAKQLKETEKGSKAAANSGGQAVDSAGADAGAQVVEPTGLGSKSFAKKIVTAQAAVAIMSAGEQVGTAGWQAKISNLQADSKEALAVISILKAMVDQSNGTYKTLNDSVQGMIKSHTDVIDDVNKALSSRSQLNQSIAANYNA